VQPCRPDRLRTENTALEVHSRNRLWQNALLEAAGFATLYVLPFAAGFLSASHTAAYHSLHPLTTIYRAILIVLFGAWLLGLSAIYFGTRAAQPWRRILGLAPFTLLPWLLCRAIAGAFVSLQGTGLAIRGATFVWLASALFGIALFLFRPSLLDRCFSVTRIAYRVAAFGMVVLLPRVALHAWSTHPRELQSFQHANLPAVSPSEPRIVWVLMDELSYDQTFEHRAPSVALPNFDALAESSVVFSNLQPAGDSTEKVIPGLLLGKPLAAMRLSDDGSLAYRTAAHRPWQQFDQRDTIFAQAQALGWTTGVAGWFNPYCRLMPDVLDRCFWQFSEPVSGDLSRYLSSTQPTSQNVLAMMPLRHMLSTLLHRPFGGGASPHRRDYTAVMAQAADLVRDPRIRFIFIHLNVPHPAGIYDRTHQSMSDTGTYLDNLVLADRSLATLRNEIQATPAAANTALIVSSDHSWRTYLWKGSSAWSREDEQATHGRFDPRPVLIVHLPASDERKIISAPISLMFVHTLLESMLHGQIRSESDIDTLRAKAMLVAAKARATSLRIDDISLGRRIE
jgi:hypothetical protein